MTLPSCLASSSRPTLARMIFCSVVMVSSNAPRRGASPPRPLCARLGSRFAVGTGHLCQIKFWLMHISHYAPVLIARDSVHSAHAIAPALYPNLSYDPTRDFSYVVPLGITCT